MRWLALSAIVVFQMLQGITGSQQHPFIVQSPRNATTSSGTDVSVTLTSTKNPLLVVATTRTGSSDSVSSVTDNIGNTYAQASNARGTVGAATSDIWYCLNAAPGVTATTVHWGVTASNNRIAWVYEVGGLPSPAFDIANHGNAAGSGNVITGASVTTTSAAGFVAAIVQTSGAISQNPNSGNECTAGGSIDPSNIAAACSILSLTAASHNAAWHDTSAAPNEVNSVAAFK